MSKRFVCVVSESCLEKYTNDWMSNDDVLSVCVCVREPEREEKVKMCSKGEQGIDRVKNDEKGERMRHIKSNSEEKVLMSRK